MNNTSKIKRELKAIVFSDIVGFTEMSSEDEKKAFSLLEIQREILKPIVEEFDGEWLKEIGDGLLLTFHSVSAAVDCSIKIQKASKSIPNLNLRIAVHEGEVAIKGNDVFGSDVNIASRIEPFSAEGGIAISGKVQQNLSSLPEYETKFVDQPLLKGVKQEVKIYCITSHGLPEPDILKVDAKIEKQKKPFFYTKKIIFPLTGFIFSILGAFLWLIYPLITFSTATTIEYDKKIAVLYFENKGEESANYITDGLTIEIINKLSKIKNLSVASRFDVIEFKDIPINLDNIKEKLDVNFLLMGDLIVLGSRIKISAELIDLDKRNVPWAESYEKDLNDIFEIQKEVALNVVKNLNIEINDGDTQNVLADPAKNSEIYDLLLRTMDKAYSINTSQEDREDLIKELNIIVEMDTTFAEALAIRSAVNWMILYHELNKDWNPHSEYSKNKFSIIISDSKAALRYDPNNITAKHLIPLMDVIMLSKFSSYTESVLTARRALLGLNKFLAEHPDYYMSYFMKGIFHLIRNDYDYLKEDNDIENAIKFLKISSDRLRRAVVNDIALPIDKLVFSESLHFLSQVYNNNNYHSESIEILDQLIDFHEKESNFNKLKNCLFYQSINLSRIGYHQRCIDVLVRLNEISDKNEYYSSLSYKYIAYSYAFLGNYKIVLDIIKENAPENYFIANQELEGLTDPDIIGQNLENKIQWEYQFILGISYLGLKKFDYSNFHLSKSIKLIEEKVNEHKNDEYLYKEYFGLSSLPKAFLALQHLMTNDSDNAKLVADQIFERIKINQTPNDLFYTLDIYLVLAEVLSILKSDVKYQQLLSEINEMKNKITEKLNEKDTENFINNYSVNKWFKSFLNTNI